MKARILLKADASEAVKAGATNQINRALETAHPWFTGCETLGKNRLKAVLSASHERRLPCRDFRWREGSQTDRLGLSQPPKGRAAWTLRLLEDKVVELNIVDRASDSTIGRHSQKTFSKPHLETQWVIPPKANSAFVAAMEDVLAVYTRPRDPDIPLV